jgi:regulatory protein
MKTITGLKEGKRRDRRINVFLDGAFAFSLAADVVAGAALRVGQELSPGQERELASADEYRRCYNAATRFLGYRPRSRTEVRARLIQHGYAPPTVDKVIARLRELELLDDAAFARYWADNREEFSPRGRRLVKLELQRKGLDREIIEQAVAGVDDEAGARRAAEKKLRTLSADDYDTFRRRLGDYLARRGFSYDIIERTVAALWRERRGDVSDYVAGGGAPAARPRTKSREKGGTME